MRIVTGEYAKSFQTEDVFRNIINTEDFKNRTTLLAFFSFASCSLCNLRVHELIQHYAELKPLGLEIITVFESSRDNILQYVGKQNAPFPIIADPKKKLYKLYDVEASWTKLFRNYVSPKWYRDVVEASKMGFKSGKVDGPMNRMPADFLIGSDMKILKSYYGKHTGDHLPLETIKSIL